MSTTSLDPTVVQKLQHFSRRRLRMIALRGLCAGVLAFVVCMAVVAFCDWRWVLSDNVRQALSATGYFITASVVWFVCGRKLTSLPAREEIAAQVESAEPELREQLLSAVELATDNPQAVNDSPVFRSLLQGNVTRQMGKIKVTKLLPMKLMSKWLLAAVAVIVGIAVLMNSGGPRFRSLAARAVLPMANIDRVSRVSVEILQPTPHSLMIAKDETVAVVVRTSGGDVKEAILETFLNGKPPLQQTMTAKTESEFVINLQIDEDVIEYRILAGDAVTKRHTINGRSRPKVVSFNKTFRYPEYSGRQQKTVTEDHGDIVVLAGTEVLLEVDLDQEVSKAELQIDITNSQDVLSVPMIKNRLGRWSTSVPVDKDAIYKVLLVSAETGFENLFSPRYELRPLPDLIPIAGFVDQQETNLLLPPNDILSLQGMAEDDLPLERLQQEISVNGREWVSVPLEASAVAMPVDEESAAPSDNAEAYRIQAAWNWDLLGLKLKTGDQVTTRLVATDLNGSRGESVPLRIVVSSPDFDPDRHATMESKAQLVGSLKRFALVVDEHKQTALEIIKTLQEESKQPLEQRRTGAEIALDCTTLRDLANKIRDSATVELQKVQATTKTMPAGVHAYDLDLTGRVLAKIVHNHAASSDYAVCAWLAAEDPKQRQQLVGRLKESFNRAGEDAKSLAYHYTHLVAQDIFNAFAWDFHAVYQQQALIANSATQTFPRLRRQETLVVNQLQTVERLAKKHRPNVPDFLQNHLDQITDFTDLWIGNLEQSMESEEELQKLQRHAQDLWRDLKNRQRYHVIDGGMANRLTQARRDLDYRSGSLVEPLSLMSTATHQETRRRISALAADDSTKADALMNEAAVYAREVDFKLRPSIEQVRTRRVISQTRIDSDSQFAADAGMTHRATNYLMNQHRQGDPNNSIVPTAFHEIAPAYRILEAGHDVVNVQTLLDTLLAAERWKSMDIVAVTQHPAQWDAVQKGLEEAVQKMRHAGISNEVLTKFDQLKWSATTQEIGRKITQRRWNRDEVVSAAADLSRHKIQLAAAVETLQPQLATARAVVEKYAPTIPEMAEQLAAQVRELEKDTTDTADSLEQFSKAESPTADEPKQQLAALEDQQETVNQQLDDLFEALVEDANQQDLLNKPEQERARDADDSIAMVQEPAEQMNKALADSLAADTPNQQAKSLSQAAEQQEKTAQALDLVARHFEKLEQGENIAETRQQLRDFEREMGLARQMDQQFQDIQQLAQMTTPTNEESLLELLENELSNNPAMREALSEISQNTVEEARNALNDLANQDKEIRKANERSDEQFQQKKKELAKQLQELARDASGLHNKLVAQAESAASQAQTPEAKQQFQQTRQQLQEAASSASKSSESDLLEELATNAKQASSALIKATEAMADATRQSGEAKNQKIHKDDKTRQNAKKNLENQRKRFSDQWKREADQRVRQRDGEERQAGTNVRNAENNVRKFQRDLQLAEKRAQKKPDDEKLKNQIRQAEARKQQAEQQVEAAQKAQQRAQQKENDARKTRDELNSRPQEPLNDENPAAQLAEKLGGEATDVAKDLAKKSEALASQLEFGDQLSPKKQQLAKAVDDQQNVKEDVAETGKNLARAARHEHRLDNQTASKALQESADNVQNVADNEASAARQQLETDASAAPDSQADAESSPSNTADNKPKFTANVALQQSEMAIAQQAESLTTIVDAAQAAHVAEQESSFMPEAATASSETADSNALQGEPPADGDSKTQATSNTPSGDTASAGSSQQQPSTPEEIATGQLLAQALDELDRAQSMSQAGMPDQEGESSSAQSSPQQLPLSLVEAAMAKAAELAQQRSQAQQQQQRGHKGQAFKPNGTPEAEGPTTDFLVKEVNRQEQADWGKLRGKEAEDLTKGRKEAVSAEYRKSVEAYFKVLAERARRRNAN